MPTLQQDSKLPALVRPSRLRHAAHAGSSPSQGSEGALSGQESTRSVAQAAPANPCGNSQPRFHGLMLLIGTSLFTSGATLVGVSFLDSNPHLWNWGVPLAIGGQCFFLFGLLLQLELPWKHERASTAPRRPVSEKPSPWHRKRPVREMGGESGYGVPSVPPETLLRDLKSRLATLGDRLSQSRA